MNHRACLVMTLLCAMPVTAHADSLYVFGDSLSDCCFAGAVTNDGLTNWVDRFADKAGVDYPEPRAQGEDHADDPRGGVNFAIGGAQSGDTSSRGDPYGLGTQVETFLSGVSDIEPGDIAAIWIGTNDIHPSAASPKPIPGRVQPAGPQPEISKLADRVIENIAGSVGKLYEAGFREIILLTPYDMGNSTFLTIYDADTPENRTLMSLYSRAIRDEIMTFKPDGPKIHAVDVFGLLEEIQADPIGYGFGSDRVTAENSCKVNDCETLSAAEQNSFVFLDEIHFTNAFHDLVAERAEEVYLTTK